MAEIKNRLTLDGSQHDSVIDEVTGRVLSSFDKMREAAQKGGDAFKFTEHAEGARKLREILHVLHPVLGEVGIGFGELGSFARVATAGIPAFAVALAGTLGVALAKLAEETDKTQTRLKSLGGGPGSFAELSKQAKQLGVDTKSLQPIFEQTLKTRQAQQSQEAGRGVIHVGDFTPPNVRVLSGGKDQDNGPLPLQVSQDATSALIQEARRDLKTSDALAAVNEFQRSSEKGLTPESLKSLSDRSPSAAKFLTDQLGGQFGRKFQSPAELADFLARNPLEGISQNSTFQELAKGLPQANKDFESSKGVEEAFDKLTASATRLGEAFGKIAGSKIFNGPAETASTALGAAADFTERHGDVIGGLGGALVKTGGNLPAAILQNLPLPDRLRSAKSATGNFIRDALFDPEKLTDNASIARHLLEQGENPAAGFADGGEIDGDNPALRFAKWIAMLAMKKQQPIDSSNMNAIGIRGAGGGHISGPGTTTSDSIPIMASDKEFIVNAKSTARFLPLLHWINAKGYADGGETDPLKNGPDVLDLLKKKKTASVDDAGAFGRMLAEQARGQAEADAWEKWARGRDKFASDYAFIDTTDLPKPEGYAGGGLIGGMSDSDFVDNGSAGHSRGLHPVTLNFNGKSIGGLFAKPDIVDTLSSLSADSQAVRTGQRPSWW